MASSGRKEIDIFLTASLLVKAHGNKAPAEASRRADEMLDQGDWDGAALWLRVGIAADALLSEAGAAH